MKVQKTGAVPILLFPGKAYNAILRSFCKLLNARDLRKPNVSSCHANPSFYYFHKNAARVAAHLDYQGIRSISLAKIVPGDHKNALFIFALLFLFAFNSVLLCYLYVTARDNPER